MTINPAMADRLTAVAIESSGDMRAVADGKPADQPTHSDARSLFGIATLELRDIAGETLATESGAASR